MSYGEAKIVTTEMKTEGLESELAPLKVWPQRATFKLPNTICCLGAEPRGSPQPQVAVSLSPAGGSPGPAVLLAQPQLSVEKRRKDTWGASTLK